jgi:hypothetical protein
MAEVKIDSALRKALSEVEAEKATMSREVGQLRRQVRELESALAAERQRLQTVLDMLRNGTSEMLARCDEAARRPRAELDGHRPVDDELEEDPSPSPKKQNGSAEPLCQELPESRSSWPEMSIWKVPLRRRMQTLCTLLFTWTTPLLLSSLLVLYIAVKRNRWAILLVVTYVGWMFVLDDESPRNGRPWWFVRRVRNLTWLWKFCAEYYPLQLVRTRELKPEGNYMFCLHPHGVFSLSHAINFATNGTGFFSKFPGIKCLLVTLRQQFKVPFHREYLLGLGAVEVSRESLLNTLTRGPGWSVAIVPGGAQEALDAVNGTMRLTLLRRKGFVRIALRTGTSLVPVFAFGENELYTSVKGAKRLLPIRLWQSFIKKCYGIASPTVMGRGVFTKKCPDPFMLPFRKPVTTVVGPPLELPRIPEPLPSDVDYWHAKYVEKLKELWELSAETYAPGVQLELV